MKAQDLRHKFIEFFKSKGHQEIPSASLIPEDDPTILFTPAGMSPLVRYLMGEPHPLGKRLCSVQKCVRTDDINEVGDLTHFTFFEMLGNWSLGDYFKIETINWSFEFLTDKKWLGLDPQKIYISVFKGDQDAPRDEESIKLWQTCFLKIGITAKIGDPNKPNFLKGERIFAYDKICNWWGPAGRTGPCGPDTEMFYDTGKHHNSKFGKYCHPNCQCGRFLEIWNDVFMEYNKKEDGNFEKLKQKNVDTGMGLERVVPLLEFLAGKITAVDPFQTHLFANLRNSLIDQLKVSLNFKVDQHLRIFLDHSRAAVFIIGEGINPGNKDREYILRRLIRRACDQLTILKLDHELVWKLAVNFYSQEYGPTYKELRREEEICQIILGEVTKYQKVVCQAEKMFPSKQITGHEAFQLFSSCGLSLEQLKEKGFQFNEEEFLKEFKKHQEVSRKGMTQKFTGGLQDQGEEVVKLHTATHLLHAALRQVLGPHVQQVGSNITQERLRFDFTHPQKLTLEQVKQVQDLVNEQIKKNLKIDCKTMALQEAKEAGALAFFGQKYPEKVKVYGTKDPSASSGQAFSLEVCGGPHVDFTGSLGMFRIKKEEASGAGKRRIYGVLKKN